MDVSSLMILVYLVSFICAVYLWISEYESYFYGKITDISISFIPTCLFCCVIIYCILLYSNINLSKERHFIKIENTQLLDIICWITICSSIFIIIVYFSDVVRNLTSGDILEIRNEAVTIQRKTPIERLSGPLRIIGSIAGKFAHASYLLLPYFFYSLCFKKNNKLFNLLIFISTLTPIVMSITRVDRSATTYYLMQLALAYFIFKPYFDDEKRKIILKYAYFFVGTLVAYLCLITIAKWGEKDEGVFTKIALYIGEPFINFCNTWNKYEVLDDAYWGNVFPVSSTLLGLKKSYLDYMDYTLRIYNMSGVRMNVFVTFLGTYLFAFGKIGTIFLSAVVVVINKLVCSTVKKTTIDLFSVYCIYVAGVGILCGLTVHYYNTIEIALSAYIYLIMIYNLTRKRRNRTS